MQDIEELGFKELYGSKHLKLKEELNVSENSINYCNTLIEYILENHKCLTKKQLEMKMNKTAKDNNINKKPRNFIINYIVKQKIDNGEINEKEYNILNQFLLSKSCRSQSGILQIAIMTSAGDFSCDYDCYYCPKQEGMPRSYVAEGPSARRAIMMSFDTIGQFYERASSYALNGHPVDKIEIIVLGGTWDSYPIEYQRKFVRDVYRAANTFYMVDCNLEERDYTMEEEIKMNETTLCKIIGFTIETRPDQISKEQIKRLLSYGVTRVQIGIQHTDNKILKKINRQCPIEKSYLAIYLLKEAGLKVQTHWMPNLPGATPELDKEMFDELNFNHKLKSDDIKIYPTIVTKTSEKDNKQVYTVIEEWYNEGKYHPYSNQELNEVIMYGKDNMDESTRISRVFRDIPMGNIKGGANVPNLREVLHKNMAEEGLHCSCIKCHEVGNRKVNPTNIKLRVIENEESYSKEYFISMVSYIDNIEIEENRVLHGFVRLRIPRMDRDMKEEWIEEIAVCALIREVHVYGKMNPTFKNLKSLEYNQHKGLGRKMIKEAERLAVVNGFYKISITSGVGVRKYYEKLGYHLGEYYMIKNLPKPIDYKFWFVEIIFIIIAIFIY